MLLQKSSLMGEQQKHVFYIDTSEGCFFFIKVKDVRVVFMYKKGLM